MNQASKALQHYYVHSSSSEERGPVSRWGERAWTETPVKQSFLARRARALADHRETGRGEKRHASTNEEDNHMEQSSVGRHHTQTQTDQGAIFSHGSDRQKEVTAISLSHKLLLDHLPLSPSFSSIWSLSFYLALLMWYFQSFSISPHTSTHLFIFTQFDDHICITVLAAGLCLSGRSCAGILSTRKQPWLWI